MNEGPTVIACTVEDIAGNTGTDTLTITYDGTSPTVRIVSPNRDAGYYTGFSTVSLTGSSSDNILVSQVTYSLSGATSGNGTATGTTSWSISGLAINAGTTTIKITARDSVGNSTVDSLGLIRTTQNKYVDLGLTSPGGNGSSANPYGWDEFMTGMNIVAGDQVYMKGKATFNGNVTKNDRVFYVHAWDQDNPWRMNLQGFSLDWRHADVYDGIIIGAACHINRMVDCYAEITSGQYQQTAYGTERCVLEFKAGGAAAYGIFDRGLQYSCIICAYSQPLRNGSGFSIENVVTNRTELNDFTDGSYTTVDKITYSFSFNSAPAWDTTTLTSFSRGGGNAYVPWWAR